MLDTLKLLPHDPMLAMMGQFHADKNTNKVDLGVGIYRNNEGQTPVMVAVKKAEQLLVDEQESKAYIGMLGRATFVEEISKLTFNAEAIDNSRLFGMQTTGGTAALRLAADLVKRSNANARVWISDPTWINHEPILNEAGIDVVIFPYYDSEKRVVTFDKMMNALSGASTGDAVLMQACCHNPTGADLTPEQWKEFAIKCNELGLTPIIDSAYQGLGDGLIEDRTGLNIVATNVPEAIFTVSCSKNFGLYRERTGAIFVLAKNSNSKDIAQSQLFSIARANYSMPPDHGAAIVSIILQNQVLYKLWEAELSETRERILSTRHSFEKAWGVSFESSSPFLIHQKGMFSMMPILPIQIEQLKKEHSIYMANDGRINVAGLKNTDISRVVEVFKSML